MSNWRNRVAHLQKEHERLDKQIDSMIENGLYEDNAIHNLKKQRLLIRDEIAKLQAQHSDES